MFLAAGDLAGKVLAFIITVIRTRSLSPAEFGGFGFIVQTIGMFAQVAGFALGLAATRYVALYRHTEPDQARQVAQFITLFGLVTTAAAAVLMWVLAPQLTQNVPGLVEPLRWSISILVLQTLSGLILGLLAGLERFRAATLAMFFQNVVMLALTAWWAPTWGLLGTILAMAAGFGVTLVIGIAQTWDLIGGRWSSAKAIWSHRQVLTAFCLPLLLGGMIIVPAQWLSTALIAAETGPPEPLLAGVLVTPPMWLAAIGLAFHYASGLTQVALFTAADQFRPMLSMLANVVAQPMMPIVTQQVRHVDDLTLAAATRAEARRRARRAAERGFQLAACLILPAHAFLAFAAPYVMAIFGRTFAADWNVFLIVLLWGAMAGMSSLIGVALNALGKVWHQNAFVGIYGITLVTLTYVLRERGAYALALANLAASLLCLILAAWVLRRSGVFSGRALVIQLGAFVWMVLMSLGSAATPDTWRPAAVAAAVLVTFLVLSLLQRAELAYVWMRLRRRLGR
jgi:O-antigen/teichoic acid export membrane protein